MINYGYHRAIIVTFISQNRKEVPESASFFRVYWYLNPNLTSQRVDCIDKKYIFAILIKNISKIKLNDYEENFTLSCFIIYDNGHICR